MSKACVLVPVRCACHALLALLEKGAAYEIKCYRCNRMNNSTA